MTSSAKARQGLTTKLRQLVVDVINNLHVPQVVYGVVQSHTTGPARVSLTLQGTSTVVPGIRYLASYTPTNGDTVLCHRYGTDLLVIGKVAA